MTRGLVCRGDGETCRRMVDSQTGEMANRNSEVVLWKDDLPCEGKQCPYYGKQCKEVMNLQFLLPTVEGLGVWQIDTSSINSIRNINSGIELIRGVYGRISMLPLSLTLEPIEVVNPDDGKKKTVRVLNLRTKGTMLELMELAVKPAREMLLPAPVDTEAPEDMKITNGVVLPDPDDESPELIMPQNQVSSDSGLVEDLFPEDPPHAKEASRAAHEAVVEREPTEPPPNKGIVNQQWLKDSLVELVAKGRTSYTEESLLGYMRVSYKGVEGDTVKEIASKLDKGQAAHFVKVIQDELDKL